MPTPFCNDELGMVAFLSVDLNSGKTAYMTGRLRPVSRAVIAKDNDVLRKVITLIQLGLLNSITT